MLTGLNVKHRSHKISQRIDLLVYFIEVMFIIDSFSNREVHLLESVDALHNLIELMLSINLIHRVVESFQVRQVSVDLSEIMSPVNGIYRTL